jgi:integrase
MKTLLKPTSTVTLAGALEELLEQTAQRVRDGVRSPATLEMQRAHVRYWLKAFGAALELDQVDEELLDRHANRPRPVGAAGPATLRKRLSTLRATLELAHRRRWISRVPAFPVVLAPWRPRQRYLETYRDAERLFESLPLHRAEWFWICLWTCQHASDVDRMTWADIDLRRSTMLIRNTKNRRPAIRVRMPAPLVPVLRDKFTRERPRAADPIVRPWPSRNTTLPRHCRKLGLLELNAIDLRHTGLSWAARIRGITPALCKFAGHSSPAMMSRTYAHALPPQLEEVTADLESMAAPANDQRPASLADVTSGALAPASAELELDQVARVAPSGNGRGADGAGQPSSSSAHGSNSQPPTSSTSTSSTRRMGSDLDSSGDGGEL